jgi:hypothetical protein
LAPNVTGKEKRASAVCDMLSDLSNVEANEEKWQIKSAYTCPVYISLESKAINMS